MYRHILIYSTYSTKEGKKENMVNMSVIHIKDIIKNLVKFIIFIGIVMLLARFFSGGFDNQKQVKISKIFENIQ